jgi:hypothetical protein
MAAKKQKEYQLKDHQLSITYLHIWLRLLIQNKVSPSKYPMEFRIWLFVVLTQPFQWLQKILFHYRIKKVDLDKEPPVFIIGHWRTGTTYLHYIMARDQQFGFLSNYQAFLLNVSLIGRTWLKVLLSPLMPDKRPQDNVKMTPDEPAEEEQPFTNQSSRSGMQSFFFPKNAVYHERYHLFRNIRPWQKRKWRVDYTFLLKTISYVNGKKRLVLKNPHNTSRIKELLELFPNAKFIFLHRHPYDTFLSTRHHYKKVISTQFLQEFSDKETEERILYFFETMIQKYLDERHLIPSGNLIEVSFDELDNQPLQTVRKIYDTLQLPNLDKALPTIQSYLSTVTNYEKNKFELPGELKSEIRFRWAFAFKEWGYEV